MKSYKIIYRNESTNEPMFDYVEAKSTDDVWLHACKNVPQGCYIDTYFEFIDEIADEY